MGEVYAAEDLELHETVALKTLRPEIAADSRNLRRLKQEIQLSRKVAHPHVCRVYDLARDPVTGPPEDATYFLTMQLLRGETLEARIRRAGRLEPTEALPLVDQMAAALDAAHTAGIIHRDFKPSNVMLVPDSRTVCAVVTDFGLARSILTGDTDLPTQTLPGHLMGTPEYMAPELFAGKPATVASDLYAFGMTIYKIVTGTLPARARGPRAGGAPIAVQEGAVAASTNPKWQAAVQRALDPDPARRFSSAAELAAALHPATAETGARPKIGRREAIAAAVGAILISGAIGLRSWSNLRRRPPAEAERLYRVGTEDLHGAAYFAATKALQQAIRLAPGFSLAHARLAEAFMELEDFDNAGREMLLARREDVSGLSGNERLQLDAIELSITREFPASAAKYEQMLKTSESEKGEIYLEMGNTYDKAAKQPEALQNYQLAVHNSPNNPACWLRLATLHSQSQPAKAQDEFARAEELYQMTSNLEGLTELAYQRSVDALRRNKLLEAESFAQKALGMAVTTGNVHQQIRAKLQLGSNAYLSGDPAAAERYAIDALATAQSNHIESLAIRGILVLGNAYRRRGDFNRAEKHYWNALEMARRNNTQRLKAVALLSLAGLHSERGSPEDASREAREALAFFLPNHFARESCQCLTVIGRFQRDRGDPAALDSAQQCLQIAQQAQDAFQKALAHETLGSLLTSRERFPEGLEHHRLELQLSTDAAHACWGALHCARVLWQMGQYEEAEEMLAKAESKAARLPNQSAEAASIRAAMLVSRQRFVEALTTS
jgi:tetratricopeptide (TPR) repeat protein